jgi:C1A family cysteine protease
MPYQIARFGWLPDPPDHRDFQSHHDTVQKAVLTMSEGANAIKSAVPSIPPAVDLRQTGDEAPIFDQGNIGSCTAHAVVGLAEYMQHALYKEYLAGSRMFLYKATRSFLGWTGDTGAFVRSTIKSLRLFGMCPEDYWPYVEAQFDAEPTAFCYAFGANYKAIAYYRLDGLDALKMSLAQGLPFAFGFSCFESLRNPDVQTTGVVPFPRATEKQIGGHAIMAVGYDDGKDVGLGGEKGALLFRNSWGCGWGDKGYGWLPYKYVEVGLATDFWALTDTAYVPAGVD